MSEETILQAHRHYHKLCKKWAEKELLKAWEEVSQLDEDKKRDQPKFLRLYKDISYLSSKFLFEEKNIDIIQKLLLKIYQKKRKKNN